MSTTSAVSIATSVPAPIAMPTSAWASAGASLTPSPTIATLRPCAWSSATLAALSPGSTSAMHLVDADLGARSRSAVARLSPVSMTGRTPSSFSAATAAAAVSRGASAIAISAGGAAVDARRGRRCGPRRRARRRARRGRRARCPRGRAGARCRPRAACPSTVASAPWPGTASNAVGARRLERRARSAALTIASASGCSLSRSSAGDQAQHLVLVDAVGGRDRDDLGLAARERAGLVEHDGVERGGLLDRHRVLEQDAALGAEPGADHDRRRRRQPERVGAGDHDDGDREQQRVLHVAADDEVPDDERAERRRSARRARARTRPGRRAAAPAPSSSAPPGRA